MQPSPLYLVMQADILRVGLVLPKTSCIEYLFFFYHLELNEGSRQWLTGSNCCKVAY